ncbi:MAG: FISUMP domain-containing protein, partial [Bacteroidales bacterium]|nr:FISUMP domain-containing protein [Bacteroidales bacterium]
MKKNILLLAMGLLLFSCGLQDNPDPGLPSVSIGIVTDITTITATCGGNVTADGGAAVTARGVCWSTSENPTTSDSKTTNGTDLGAYIGNITGLSPNTTYYVRAYATNANGTAYGQQKSFRTYDTFTDSRDGKVYKLVTIGSQVWMAENLAYLPSVNYQTDGSENTGHETDPFYYVYGYDGTNVAAAKATDNYTTYGVLYNWKAAQAACPEGWHLPSDAEWTTLTDYLGEGDFSGCKMKEAGITHWESNSGATNESGFTALPGGYRDEIGCALIGLVGSWWTSNIDYMWARGMISYLNIVQRDYQDKIDGFSVRCVRNNNFLTVTTEGVINITTISASCSGNVTSDGGSSVTARGVCWSTSENPTTSDSKTTNGTGLGAYTGNITGLSLSTTYYIRAYATNSQGTAYGVQRTFTTLPASDIEYGSLTDSRDGNQYKTVTIGSQVWMAENLAYLPSVVGPETGSEEDPYYYVYGYDGTNVAAAKA